VAQPAHTSRRCARSARSPRDGDACGGVAARPAETPRGIDGGCTGQGGAAGFSSAFQGGGGAPVAGRASTSPAAGGEDKGGEVWSKRGGRQGCRRAHRGGGGTMARRREDGVAATAGWPASTLGQGKGGWVTDLLESGLVREDERVKERGGRSGDKEVGGARAVPRDRRRNR
jgi:hypothetical protein